MSTATKQIEDYALVGDLRTGALIATDGSVDWLSFPRFDAPAVFAALLGTDEHGRWTLAPIDKDHCFRRRYRPGTLILETDWTTDGGAVRVTDLMDPSSAVPQLIRIVDGLVGTVAMETSLAPRANYGQGFPVMRKAGGRLVATNGSDAFWLDADIALRDADGTWSGQFAVAAGERITFTFTHTSTGASPTSRQLAPVPAPDAQLKATDAYWTDWSSRSTYVGPWQTEVTQSLVMLKALTYAPTGSILAAATTSLPELIGGERNWDYRYSWLRDATFTIRAFLAAGFLDEAIAWRAWLLDAIDDSPGDVQIMYGLEGERHLPEQIVDWLPGFADSGPVRIGNAAATQQQNDVFGEVLDALTAMQAAGAPPAPGEAKLRATLLDHVLATSSEPDHGLWEIRGPRRHFVHSKLMAWVGLDRTIDSLESNSEPDSDDLLVELRGTRDALRREILDRGFQRDRRAFTQSYGSSRLDAAVLLMPAYGFLPWTDPSFVATVETLQRELTEHGLMLRYATEGAAPNVDGLPGSEGVFIATSFWLADALHEMGRHAEAAALFQRLLSLRNDVGMLAEEYDPRTGSHLGNTPQAFSHAALVTTAQRLSQQAQQIDAAAFADTVAS